MLAKTMIGLLAAAAIAAPLVAQSTTSEQTLYEKGLENKGSPNAPAVNAVEGPVTDQLNNSVVAAQNTATATTLDAKAQYEADRQAYADALAAHDAAVNRTDTRYIKQQVAYADAMTAWRDQVRACKKGYKRACNAPTPNPVDYYNR